jgi:hypothetical protein
MTAAHIAAPATFIGLGAQKAATTWLHDVLAGHPEVFVSEPKEVDFFSHWFNRGYDWYDAHFAVGADRPCRGETSPSYMYDPAAPGRARAYNPGLRLIAVLRDPVARAYSNHLHEIRQGRIPPDRTFEEAEPRNPMYVEQGRYATHLQRWIDVFGRDALLVLIAEEISADPETALDRTYAHLGVKAGVRPRGYAERRHESVAPRLQGVQGLLRAGGSWLRANGLREGLDAVKRFPPVRAALALNQRDVRRDTAPMRPETRARLEAAFAEEGRRLADLLGRDSLPWSCWRAAAA